MKKILFLICFGGASLTSLSQVNWQKGGNTAAGGANSSIGTLWNSSLFFLTNGVTRAAVTTNNTCSSWLGNSGDGIRIFAPTGSTGDLDLFTSNTSGADETHARFGGSGQVSGQNNRFEFISTAATEGNYYSTFASSGIHRFDRGQTEHGRLGTNNFWRFGQNNSGPNNGGVNAARMVEVVDNDVQFRLTFSQNSTGLYTDFLSNSNGNLQILPQNGRVGINLNANPTANLDVNGNARIRNVQAVVPPEVPDALFVGMLAPGGTSDDFNVRRLDFSGNSSQVLLGDGSWGAAPGGTVNNAQNGAWLTGNSVEWGTMPLLHDTEIPMNTSDILFQSFPTAPGTFTLGGNNYVTDSKMQINNNYELGNGYYNKGLDVNSTTVGTVAIKTGIRSYANNANRLVAIFGHAQNGNGATGVSGRGETGGTVKGVEGIAINGSAFTYGVYANASSNSTAGRAYGGYFTGASPSLWENYGVYGMGSGSFKSNFGGYFIGDGGGTTIGVYGEATNTAGLAYGGYFVGNMVFGQPSIPSDAQFKTNVAGMTNADAILQALNPVTYDYLQTGNAQYMHFPQGNQFGLIAQEVETILPELVNSVSHPERIDSLGNIVVPSFDYKTVKYQELIPILIAGHQEQQTIIQQQEAIITDLNDRLTQLENCLANILPALCNANNHAPEQTPQQVQDELRSIIDVELRNSNNIVLNQNVPNPFAERTVITYTVPATVGKAQIHFYNGLGELINSVEITERGEGQLNVFASDLSTGVYTYSLVADGKVVSTKRMVKQ